MGNHRNTIIAVIKDDESRIREITIQVQRLQQELFDLENSLSHWKCRLKDEEQHEREQKILDFHHSPIFRGY